MSGSTWTCLIVFAVLARPEVALGAVVDLAHAYSHENKTLCWNPKEHFEVFNVQHNTVGPNGPATTESFLTPEHCGTHIDAPYHFNPNGWKLDEIPLQRMIVDGVHVNVSEEVNGNGDFLLTADHLRAWEKLNGPLPRRCVMLINFGWAHKYEDRLSYYSAYQEPFRFPGMTRDAARWIVDSGKVYGVGVDVAGADPGASTKFEVHGVLTKANLYILESVALNGVTLPPRGFKLIVQPIKISGSTGGPCRILAFTKNAFE